MVLPSRMIVTESAISSISLSLWEIMMQVMPCAFSWRIRPSRCSESSSFSAAVGSSRMSSFTSLDRALAISTSCCLPTPMSMTRVPAGSSRPTREQLGGLGVRLVPVDPAALGALVAQVDVLGDRQERAQGELLVDDHDARVLAGPDVAEGDHVAVVMDLPRVGAVRVDPGQHLHQRRLPRPVLTADRVDLATLHLEVHVLEGLDSRELLGDVTHLKDVVAHRRFTVPVWSGSRWSARRVSRRPDAPRVGWLQSELLGGVVATVDEGRLKLSLTTICDSSRYEGTTFTPLS